MNTKEKLKQLAVPLQGLLLIGLCLGLVWMVFITATFDPTPPTILDIQARATQNLSYASMNSTAIALAANMIGELMPSPIVMPVTGNESGPLPTPTVAVTLRVVAAEHSATPFSIFGFLFDPTATRDLREDRIPSTVTATPLPTSTPQPTSTATRVPTLTPSRTPTPRTPTAPPSTLTPTNTVPPPPTNTPTVPTPTVPSPTEEVVITPTETTPAPPPTQAPTQAQESPTSETFEETPNPTQEPLP